MTEFNTKLFIYIAPVLTVILSLFLGNLIKSSPVFIAGLRQFSAGILIAALATELIPEITCVKGLCPTDNSKLLYIIGGFIIGALVMIGIKTLIINKIQKTKDNKEVRYTQEIDWDAIISVGVNYFLGSMLLSMVLRRSMSYYIFSASIIFELFVVGFSVASMLENSADNNKKSIFFISLICYIFASFIGFIAGFLFSLNYNGFDKFYFAVLSFCISSILWLVSIELLEGNNISKLDTRIGATLLFAGFGIMVAFNWIEPEGFKTLIKE